MSEELVPTPSLFDRDLGQEEPLVLSLHHDQPVPAYFDLVRIQESPHR